MVHEQERSGAAWALEWLTLPRDGRGNGCLVKPCCAAARIGHADGRGGLDDQLTFSQTEDVRAFVCHVATGALVFRA